MNLILILLSENWQFFRLKHLKFRNGIKWGSRAKFFTYESFNILNVAKQF